MISWISENQLEIGRLNGTVCMKTDFLLIKYLLVFVGSFLFLFALSTFPPHGKGVQ